MLVDQIRYRAISKSCAAAYRGPTFLTQGTLRLFRAEEMVTDEHSEAEGSETDISTWPERARTSERGERAAWLEHPGGKKTGKANAADE